MLASDVTPVTGKRGFPGNPGESSEDNEGGVTQRRKAPLSALDSVPTSTVAATPHAKAATSKAPASAIHAPASGRVPVLALEAIIGAGKSTLLDAVKVRRGTQPLVIK